MLRRNVLALPLAVAAAKAARPPFRLSVRVEAVFRGLPLLRQMELVAQAGYEGFEFGDWRAADASAVIRRARQLKLECACLVGNRSVNPKGMGLCDPAERDGFVSEIAASIEAAKRFESRRLVVLTGNGVVGVPRERQRASIVEGLKRASALAEASGVQLIVEVLNTLAKEEPLNPAENHNGYYLNSTREAFEILREVGSGSVKVLFDFYHIQIMEGNLIETLQANIGAIGHFHVGDVPGRHEPGTGEINYRNVFAAIAGTRFREFVAMEYLPMKEPLRTLREVRELAGF